MVLKIKADDKNLDSVNNFIHKLLPVECSEKTLNEIDLAVEEIFVNIAHYAYKNTKDEKTSAKDKACSQNTGGQLDEHPGEVEISADFKNSVLSVTFCDSGIPFNPLLKEAPDLTLSAEKRKIGGLGIFLTKKFMDSVDYVYQDKKNKLTFQKRI